MNALLLSALLPSSTTGSQAAFSNKGKADSADFATLFSKQSDVLAIDLSELTDWLQANPELKDRLLAKLQQMDVPTDTTPEALLAAINTVLDQLKPATALVTSQEQNALSSLASTASPVNQAATTVPSLVQSTLFIAQESHAIRHAIARQDLDANESRGLQSPFNERTPNATLTPLATADTPAKLVNNTPLFTATDSNKGPAITADSPSNETIELPKSIPADKNIAGLHTALAWQTPPNASAVNPSTTPATFTPSSTVHINTPMSQTVVWQNEFGRALVQLGQQAQNTGVQHAEIRVEPAELGPLRIVLSITESIANATIYAAHAQTRLTVEQALPQLQQQLAQAGLSLGDANVSEQPLFSQSEQHAEQNSSNKNTTFSLDHNEQTTNNPTLLASNTSNQRIDPNAIIDTFA